MPESNGGRRRPTSLSAETKWEIFLQVTAGEMSQAEAARKWQVDVSTVIGIRRAVKDAALAALARKPGRPGTQRDWQLEAARAEIALLTEAVKAQAIELAVCGENPVGADRASAGAGPRRGEGAGSEDGRRRGHGRVHPYLDVRAVAGVRLAGASLAGTRPRHRHPGRPGTRRASGPCAAARGDRRHPRRHRTLGRHRPLAPQARPPRLLPRFGVGVASHVSARADRTPTHAARASTAQPVGEA